MNERFVCVKVDREERPDVDAIYMDAVQAMTGRGGWPLNAFATPEQVPFYAGTYFPPRAAHGMPSWRQVLEASPRRGRERARRSSGRAGGSSSGSGRGACSSPSGRARAAACSMPPWRRCARPTTRPRRFRRRAEVPAGVGDRVAARAAARRDDGAAHAARDGRAAGSTTRSAAASRATRSTPPGSCRTSRRCSTTTRCSRAPTCTAGRSAATRLLRRVCGETLDWVLRELRGPEGGFYSRARRRHRGRRGQVLRLDARTSCARRSGTAADGAIAWSAATRARQLRGRERARARGDGADPPRARARSARACSRRASGACGRASTTSG